MAHKVKWKETKNGPEKTGYEMAHLDFCDDACSVYGHPYCLLQSSEWKHQILYDVEVKDKSGKILPAMTM